MDRLSSLPDDLIHKILSYISLQDAIGTSSMSSRWRYIWTSMPYLSFSSEDFSTLPKFAKFVTNVLSRRNDHVEVSCVNLKFRGKITQVFVKSITNYASSHNVQQLNVTFLLENDIEVPLSLFTFKSLKHLNLTKEERARGVYNLKATSNLELPALTTLYLHDIILCCDDSNDDCNHLFSKCAFLKNLYLDQSRVLKSDGFTKSKGFTICHPSLSDLTLKNLYFRVNVVTPHLKNLTIADWSNEHRYMISAPNLSSLMYKGSYPWHLNTDGFPSLEKADIIVRSKWDADAHKLVCLLQELHNVQYLKLSLEAVEILSSSGQLSSYQPSPFANLKSLMIYPGNEYSLPQLTNKETMYSEVKSYFLDRSPSASFTMVLREEAAAKKLMSEVQLLLKQENVKTETYGAHVEQGKPQLETKWLLQVEGCMAQIQSCWENLRVQIEQREATACLILSKLQNIKELLTVLPASRKAMIQPCFSCVCAEADFVNSKMTDCLKMQCDETQSRLRGCFHEFATTLDQSS